MTTLNQLHLEAVEALINMATSRRMMIDAEKAYDDTFTKYKEAEQHLFEIQQKLIEGDVKSEKGE